MLRNLAIFKCHIKYLKFSFVRVYRDFEAFVFHFNKHMFSNTKISCLCKWNLECFEILAYLTSTNASKSRHISFKIFLISTQCKHMFSSYKYSDVSNKISDYQNVAFIMYFWNLFLFPLLFASRSFKSTTIC